MLRMYVEDTMDAECVEFSHMHGRLSSGKPGRIVETLSVGSSSERVDPVEGDQGSR